MNRAVRIVRGYAREAGRRTRRALGRQVRVAGAPPTDWARTEDAGRAAQPLDDLRFFAVLGTWHEDDVVEATVRNALLQGVERVFVVDNDSPDDTVARAVSAGAELAHRFATDEYDEAERMRLMNAVADDVSAQAFAEGARHVWWLFLDADEFHHGPAGQTLLEHLRTLDRRHRVVGARFFNHYPDRVPEYVPGHHPLDEQPLCEEHVYPMCTAGHRKHPLLRWDADGPKVWMGPGFHQAAGEEQLIEPATAVYCHHFPFREEQACRARLDALCGPGGRAAAELLQSDHMRARYAQLDAVYRHDWKAVEDLLPGMSHRGIRPRPWATLVPPADAAVARWY